jgi:hypothetical protein
LIQNPEDENFQLQRAHRKLQLNFLNLGRVKDLSVGKDEDFTQSTRSVIYYTVWLNKCLCEYNRCEEGMIVDA